MALYHMEKNVGKLMKQQLDRYFARTTVRTQKHLFNMALWVLELNRCQSERFS